MDETTKPLKTIQRKARLKNGRVVEYHLCDVGCKPNAYPKARFDFIGYGVPIEVDGKPIMYNEVVALFRRKE